MAQKYAVNDASNRVARHRAGNKGKGRRRIEVTVPEGDARLVKAIAEALRSDSNKADRIRQLLGPILIAPKARTGTELVEFFRSAPLLDDDLDITRDQSGGRTADFE